MSSYQPGPDETALLTVEVRLGTDGIYVIKGEYGGAQMLLHSTSPAIVRVEPLPKPALPKAFGSHIKATVSRRGDVERGVEMTLADPGDDSRWMDRRSRWFRDDALADVEVLHDPDATKLVAGASAPEPIALSLGALRAAEAALIGDSSEHGPLSKCGAERLGRKVVAAIEAAMNTAVDLP